LQQEKQYFKTTKIPFPEMPQESKPCSLSVGLADAQVSFNKKYFSRFHQIMNIFHYLPHLEWKSELEDCLLPPLVLKYSVLGRRRK